MRSDVPSDPPLARKSESLLQFLHKLALLRCQRVTAYGPADHVQYLADLPAAWPAQCWCLLLPDPPATTRGEDRSPATPLPQHGAAAAADSLRRTAAAHSALDDSCGEGMQPAAGSAMHVALPADDDLTVAHVATQAMLGEPADAELWLRVRKVYPPPLPPLPEELRPWLADPQQLHDPRSCPQLLAEIAIAASAADPAGDALAADPATFDATPRPHDFAHADALAPTTPARPTEPPQPIDSLPPGNAPQSADRPQPADRPWPGDPQLPGNNPPPAEHAREDSGTPQHAGLQHAGPPPSVDCETGVAPRSPHAEHHNGELQTDPWPQADVPAVSPRGAGRWPPDPPDIAPAPAADQPGTVPAADWPGAARRVRRLEDEPQVHRLWGEYLERDWRPWAAQQRRFQRLQQVYEAVDFMRRRVEEAEEQYELVFGLGLVQGVDAQGQRIERHLLTVPVEIHLDAQQGELAVRPAPAVQKLRVELDMFSQAEQPPFTPEARQQLDELLERIGLSVWDRDALGGVLRWVANTMRSDAVVHEDGLLPRGRPERTLCFTYAPALVLRSRRSTAYGDLVQRMLEQAAALRPSGDDAAGPGAAMLPAPWRLLLEEDHASPRGASFLAAPSVPTPWEADQASSGGASPRGGADGAWQPEAKVPSLGEETGGRFYFPRPTNAEQRDIAVRLQRQACVLVKGPPGTGKSHTIANLICHLLACGQRVLVTAQTPKALEVLRGLLPPEIVDLCVTAVGPLRAEQHLLEHSIQQITGRKESWRGPQESQRRIDELQGQLQQAEAQRDELQRRLRQWREAECHTHALEGGYRGTAAHIARQLEQQQCDEPEVFGRLGALRDPAARCPLSGEALAEFAQMHAALTSQRLGEVQRELGALDVPPPEQVAEALRALSRAARHGNDPPRSEDDEPLTAPLDALHAAAQCLADLEPRLALPPRARVGVLCRSSGQRGADRRRVPRIGDPGVSPRIARRTGRPPRRFLARHGVF